MGRTDQVLTGGSLSYNPLTTTMKAVLAFLIVCLVQISLAEQEDIADGASSDANLSLQREVREAARGCEKGDKKCIRQEKRQEKKKNRKNLRKEKKKNMKDRPKKVNKPRTKKSKKGAKQDGKGARKLNGKKTKQQKQQKQQRKQQKKAKDTKKRQKKKSEKGRKKGKKESTGLSRTSSTNGSGRNTTDQCFTDMVAKTKKFNKAQVEFRLAKRIESWGKLMKNKKDNSASTFSDALDAMNDATGNGTSCDGDSSSLAEAKEVQEKLANCSTSAGDNCDEGGLSIPINSTQVSSCKTTLEAFAKDFKDCLTKSTDALICSCVQGLTNPSSDCLNFKAMHDGLKTQKEKCTKGSESGSFGDCRKQERMAAKFGNKCKKSCSGPSVTTQAPAASQRMKLLRRLNQKLKFL